MRRKKEHQMCNNEPFHFNSVCLIITLICQSWFCPVLETRLHLQISVCQNVLKTAFFFHIKSHLFSTGGKKEKDVVILFQKHTTNALGHGLSLLFSARSPTLKTWSFWILIKHQGTSQGVLAWQRKLLWFMYYFVVPAWSLHVMRDCGDEWKNWAIILIC